jgi:hypothetical protein
MGRTAGQFCSRDSMYRFQDEAEMPPPMPLVDAEAVRNTAMTWQQKQEFGTTVVSDIQLHHEYWLRTTCEKLHFFFPTTLRKSALH